MPLDIDKIREDFPILNRTVEGNRLIYLDNAATSQTPRCVVDSICQMYYEHKANVHRGVHTLSQEATDRVEEARTKVKEFINAGSTEEIIFTRGTTEGINLVASSFGDSLCNGDEIIVTVMEHHSNIVPWQLLQRNCRVVLRVVPMNADGSLMLDAYEDLFTDNTRLVALAHVSNVLGTVNPVKEMIAIAHRHGVPVLVDGAQAVAHRRVDVVDLSLVDHPVEHDQRVAASRDGSLAAHLKRRGLARDTGLAHRKTRGDTPEHVEGAGLGHVGHWTVRHGIGGDRTGEIGSLDSTVTDDHGAFEKLGVISHGDFESVPAGSGNLLRLETEAGNLENRVLGNLEGEGAVEVGHGSDRRALYHYSDSGEAFAAGVIHGTADFFVLGESRRSGHQNRKA